MNNVVNGVKSRNGVASTEGVACTWPTEKKGLDALDRELALLVSVKRWVAAARGRGCGAWCHAWGGRGGTGAGEAWRQRRHEVPSVCVCGERGQEGL